MILTHHDDDHYNKISPLVLQGITFGKVYYSGPIAKYQALRGNFYTTKGQKTGNVGEYVSTINGVAQANQTIIETATDVTILCQTGKLTLINDAANNFTIDILASNVHANPADRQPVVTGFRFDAIERNSRSIVLLIKFGSYITYMTNNGVPTGDPHDLSFYRDKTDYDISNLNQAIWETWSMGKSEITYDGT